MKVNLKITLDGGTKLKLVIPSKEEQGRNCSKCHLQAASCDFCEPIPCEAYNHKSNLLYRGYFILDVEEPK